MPRNIYSRSNFKTCWDNKKTSEISSIQKLIKDQFKENYKQKHIIISKSKEFETLNSKEIISCPYCGSVSFVKNGFYKTKQQKYYCKDCHKNFCSTTNTLVSNHKIPLEQMIEFFINIFHYQSFNSASRNNKIDRKTGDYWGNKLFLCLADYQKDILLKGRIFIDEIYFKRKIIIKNSISYKQYCIAIGYDGFNIIAKEIKACHPSRKTINECFKNHLSEGSILIHDIEKSHNILTQNNNFQNIKYFVKNKQRINDRNHYVMESLHNQIRFLKIFLSFHSGFNKKNLQDYLNLFCYIQNPPYNILQKVEKTLKMFYELPITLKYDDFNKKKSK